MSEGRSSPGVIKFVLMSIHAYPPSLFFRACELTRHQNEIGISHRVCRPGNYRASFFDGRKQESSTQSRTHHCARNSPNPTMPR